MKDLQRIQTLTHRQKLLAEFGDFALRCDDLDEILTRACWLVSTALGTDLSKVLEIERGAHQALVRAGVGWQPGVVGQARISLGERSLFDQGQSARYHPGHRTRRALRPARLSA